MNNRFHALAIAFALIPTATIGCSSEGSSFDPPMTNSGASTSSGGTGNTTSSGGTTATTGGTGATTSGGTGTTTGGQGGSGNTTSGGTAGTDTGGSAGTEANGGSGNTGPVCPKPAPEICHEFVANDNSRNVVNYVNEFTGATWTAPVGVAGVNSPRSIEIVDNPTAQTGKAVMVSTHNGYVEFDLVDGTKVASVGNNTLINNAATSDHTKGVSGANRMPDGNTALGINDKIKIVSNTGSLVREFSLPTGDNLRALTRNPVTGNFWFTKTQLLYEVSDQGQVVWDGDMGAGAKGYLVWWRDGGGAYATTGEPATAIEMDGNNTILNTIGGRDNYPFLDFFSGFVHLANGNFVVANWLGHLAQPADDAPHAVEFTPANEIVWQWGNQTLARQITNVYVLQ